MLKQCAWCKSLTFNGLKVEKSNKIVPGMSHGICLSCKSELIRDYDIKNTTALPRNPFALAGAAI